MEEKLTVAMLWREFAEMTLAEIRRAKEASAEAAKLDALRENVKALHDFCGCDYEFGEDEDENPPVVLDEKARDAVADFCGKLAHAMERTRPPLPLSGGADADWDELKEAARPLAEYLRKHFSLMATAIVEPYHVKIASEERGCPLD